MALAALALSAAGCGLGSSTKTVTTTHIRTVTTTRTVTNASGQASTCTSSQLAATFQVVGGSQGAGQISYDLKLTNTSQARCYVFGLPQAQLLDAKKAVLPTKIVAASSGGGKQVVIFPGNSAVAQARFSPSVAGPGDSQSGHCQPQAWYLRVTPDGGGTIDAQIAPPTSVCESGTLDFDFFSAG